MATFDLMLKFKDLLKKINDTEKLTAAAKIYRPGFIYDEENDVYYEEYAPDCEHIKKEGYKGFLICVECGLDFGPIFAGSGPPSAKSEKSSARFKNYNKTINKMFPDDFIPDGKIIMYDIEKRFNQLEKNAISFPCMKDVIYFILKKCEREDLAETITLSKSKRSQNILEKLFKDEENTNE